MIPEPPRLMLTNASPEVREQFKLIDLWMRQVYNSLKELDIEVKISSGASAPTGGQDGDLYVRKNGASTQLYLNINGTFSGYTNP